MKKGNKNKRYTNINEPCNGDANWSCPITAEKISHSTNTGQSHCFQELDNRRAGCGPWEQEKQYELCSPSCDTEKWDPLGMLICWDEETDWRLGFEGTHLYWQGLGVGLALDISRGFHFVHSWILCAVHTHKPLWGLVVSCSWEWARGSEFGGKNYLNLLNYANELWIHEDVHHVYLEKILNLLSSK